MDAEVTPPDEPGAHANPVLWITLGVPLAAVCASVLTLFLAVREAEPPLPARYSWEGLALEHDQARAARAAALGAAATLDFESPGRLRVELAFAATGAALPPVLELHLTHATLPPLDRSLRLLRDADSGAFVAELPALQPGHWLVELATAGPAAPGTPAATPPATAATPPAAAGNDWRLRGEFNSPASIVRLGR